MSNKTRSHQTEATIKISAKNLITPFFSLIIILYLLNPYSFQTTWKGRAPYIFFMWLLLLEVVLAWRKLPKNTFDAMERKRILES